MPTPHHHNDGPAPHLAASVAFAARSATGVTIDLLAEHAWSWKHRELAAGEPFSVSFDLPLVKRQPVAALVTGNTVVSSVDRGPADLHFGEAPVVVTAGYPALSPMMGLTRWLPF